MSTNGKKIMAEHEDSRLTHTIDGHLFLWTVSKSNVKELENFEVRKDDVWIITYPKAGTHWTVEIVGRIFAGEDIDNKFRRPPIEMTLSGDDPLSLEGAVMNHKVIAEWDSPRIINTHLPWNLLPKQIKTVQPKILYVARNPKDTCVSMHKFLQKMNTLYSCDVNYATLNEYIDAFCDGSVLMGDWWRHTKGYWDVRHQDNVMSITYEGLKKNTSEYIDRIANFLERPLSKASLENILTATSFNTMKSSDAYHKKGAVMRKGDIGDWKNYFTVSQNETFNKIYEEKLKDTGLNFEFE